MCMSASFSVSPQGFKGGRLLAGPYPSRPPPRGGRSAPPSPAKFWPRDTPGLTSERGAFFWAQTARPPIEPKIRHGVPEDARVDSYLGDRSIIRLLQPRQRASEVLGVDMTARTALIVGFALIASCGGGGDGGAPPVLSRFLYVNAAGGPNEGHTDIYGFAVYTNGELRVVPGSPAPAKDLAAGQLRSRGTPNSYIQLTFMKSRPSRSMRMVR